MVSPFQPNSTFIKASGALLWTLLKENFNTKKKFTINYQGADMICEKCLTEKSNKDFFTKSKECYKCTYEKKILLTKKKQPATKCRICNKNCSPNRWVYCSKKCAEFGEIKQNKEYWIRLVKSV